MTPEDRARVALTRDLAARPEGVEITVAGASMEPAAPKGQRVRVRAARPEALRPGDVFLFERVDGGLELHRLVVALPGGWLVHRGDNQLVREFGVTSAERVIGRAELARVVPGRREKLRAVIAMIRRAIRRRR